SATAMSTLQQLSSLTTLVSLAMVLKPGEAITPAAWRAQFSPAMIRRCLVAGFQAGLAQSGLKVSVVRSAPRSFRTGSALSSAFRVILGIAPGSGVSRLVYLDLFLQADDRDLAETFLLGAAPPTARVEHRVTGVLAAHLRRYESPIGALPTS